MKLLQIDGRSFLFRRITKDTGRSFQELIFPLLDLVRMNIKLLRKFRKGLCSPRTAARATFALKAGL